MREVKFRGKRKDKSGEWLYGDLNHIDGNVYVFPRGDNTPLNSPDWFEVIPETVGMMIPFNFFGDDYFYEGDVLERIGTIDDFSHRGINTFKRDIVVVELIGTKDGFGKKEFGFSINTQRSYSERTRPATYTIIGNIHDNPELLNNEQK